LIELSIAGYRKRSCALIDYYELVLRYHPDGVRRTFEAKSKRFTKSHELTRIKKSISYGFV
jgi:hypothetical protein